jgi:hypothetical protein
MTALVVEDYGCCALEEGHDGCCAWICHHCQGSGQCPACQGTGDDGSGLDYTCMECGGGACPYCDEGLEVDDV